MKVAQVFLLLSPTLANPLFAAQHDKRQSPPSDQITITSAMTSGNGCPQGSVSTSLSPDRTVVTFGFDAFQACKFLQCITTV